MSRIFPEYKRSTVYALTGVVFHLVVVVIPLLLSGGTGEAGKSAGLIALFFDFPLTILEISFRTIEHLVVTSTMGYLLYYSLGGSLLYALGGWILGFLMDSLSRRCLRKVEG
ncbi:MAG: hypothetical protein AB7T38_17450 [Nitrospirales bacterium]